MYNITKINIPDKSILGMNYSGMHDTSIAIVAPNGEVVYAISLERITRKKGDGRFPDLLLQKIPWDKIDTIAVSNAEKYVIPDDKFSLVHPVKIKNEIIVDRSHSHVYYDQISSLKKEVEFFPHHLSHASSAFWGSGFEESICLVYDGGMRNEHWFGGVYTASRKTGISPVDLFSTQAYSNITLLYTSITVILGFKPLRHEGKITGLAAYGKATSKSEELLLSWLHNPEKLYGLFDWINIYGIEGTPELEVNYEKLAELQDEASMFSKEDLAATVQKLSEEHIIKLLENIIEQYPEYKNICLSGGLFANVKVNQKVYEYGFENIFISPPMSDDGTAIGAAWLALSKKHKIKKRKYDNMYLGNSNYIEKFLTENHDFIFQKIDKPDVFIADKLSKGYIFAIFQGRSEFGPRALGNRSIITQATQYDINNGLNDRLSRTEFMPFAPVIRDIDAGTYFEVKDGVLFTSKFMTMTVNCTEKAKDRCPAVVHVDATARPQIIEYRDNPFMYDILTEYVNLTGNLALVNTSFNIHEEPIVDSYDDALKGFFESGLDYLYLDGIIISLSDNYKIQTSYLKENIKYKEKKLKDLSLNLAKTKSKVKMKNLLITQTSTEVKEWRQKVAKTEVKMDEWKRKAAIAEQDANKALHKYHLLVASNSWKATKPFRLARKVLQRFIAGGKT